MFLKTWGLLSQRCAGPIRLEVGRFKAGPFHSERRLSESSQVGNAGAEEESRSRRKTQLFLFSRVNPAAPRPPPSPAPILETPPTTPAGQVRLVSPGFLSGGPRSAPEFQLALMFSPQLRRLRKSGRWSSTKGPRTLWALA